MLLPFAHTAGGPARITKGTLMATDSTIASLPHELTSAFQRFSKAVADLPNQCSIRKALETLRLFVYVLRKNPAWSTELDRRAAFFENRCGDGSPWRQAVDKALAILSKPLKTSDPLGAIRLQVGMGAIKGGVGCTEQLRNVIDALDVALNNTGLSELSKATLIECRRLSDALYNEALSLQADGCGTIKHTYDDLGVNFNAQSGTLEILRMVPTEFQALSAAADALCFGRPNIRQCLPRRKTGRERWAEKGRGWNLDRPRRTSQAGGTSFLPWG